MAKKSNRPEVSASLRSGADDLYSISRAGWERQGFDFEETIILYADTIPEDFAVQADDVVIVHAHGGKSGTDLSDDDGSLVKLSDALGMLSGMGAEDAASMNFAVCYSANPRHVARAWRARVEPEQEVRGREGVLDGGLAIGVNRRGVPRATILSDKRLSVVGKK